MPSEASIDQDQVGGQLASLIEQSELLNVRLTALNAEVADVVPDQINAEFTVSDINVMGGETDEAGFLNVRFEHTARFFSVEETVATIQFEHLAHFRYTGPGRPDDEVVRHWALGNVYFMVYPYVREALQSTCVRMELPAVVLGYLLRGRTMPRNISVVLNRTQFDNAIEDPEPREPDN